MTSRAPGRLATTGVEEDLRAFLSRLQAGAGGLVRVARRVDPVHELSEVVKRLESYDAPAVFFDDVAGSDFPVVAGLFGTRERVAAAFCLQPRQAVRELLSIAEQPGTTRLVDDAPCQEVVRHGDDVDLALLPAPVHSRGDAGRYVTSAVGITRDPQSGKINSGIYRVMLLGRRTVTVNVVPDNALGRILQRARLSGATTQIALVIGGPPRFVLSSQFSAGKHRDCLELAAALSGGELAVTPARTVDLDVPARAEIILEGVIDPAARTPDGPFGEFTCYPGENLAATCEISAITHRHDAIYHDVHPTHREHRYLWAYPGREAWLLRELAHVAPSLREVVIPHFGAFLSVYLALEPQHAGEARQALLGALGYDNMIKHAVAVDVDVDVWDPAAVAWAVDTRCQPDRDVIVLPGLSGVHNDPSSSPCSDGDRPDHLTAKIGIDATRPVGEVFATRSDLPAEGFESLDLGSYLDAHVLSELQQRRGSLPSACV